METLVALSWRLASNEYRAMALCRAGTLALSRGRKDEPNPEAWQMFSEALSADPASDRAFRGLRRTRAIHGTKGAPPMADVRCNVPRRSGIACRTRSYRDLGKNDARNSRYYYRN